MKRPSGEGSWWTLIVRYPAPLSTGGSAARPRQFLTFTLMVTGQHSSSALSLTRLCTRRLAYPVEPGDIPDRKRDILKAVVCSRYRKGRTGTGLVHGFGFTTGAIAGSVSHDSHNIVAVGARDEDIIRAIALVIRNRGGLVVVSGEESTILPLGCAGLMSIRPYEEVCDSLERLNRHVETIGGREDSFMYLSFLALPVIPRLRITERGLFDVDSFTDIPLFSGKNS